MADGARVQKITDVREVTAPDNHVLYVYSALMEDGTGRDITYETPSGVWVSEEGAVEPFSAERARTVWRMQDDPSSDAWHGPTDPASRR